MSTTKPIETPNHGFGLNYASICAPQGPALIDRTFVTWLTDRNADLAGQLSAARVSEPTNPQLLSALLIDIASELDAFIGELFGISEAVEDLCDQHAQTDPVLRVKYKFIKRQALLGIEPADRNKLDADALRTELIGLGADPDAELTFANKVLQWQVQVKSKSDESADAAHAIETAKSYSAWAAGTTSGRLRHRHSVLFRHPQSIDGDDRIEHRKTQSIRSIPIHTLSSDALHHRDGFSLTDTGFGLEGAVDQAKYCLICHQRGKDSCSHGIAAEKGSDAPFKISAGNEALAGCPLGERISEFHKLKVTGRAIGALTMIVLDNPMVAATGHRVCNDCMKACIYQRQTPVDIPQSETQVLRDVLALPWGFEIYALLTRWNPLNLSQPVPHAPTGYRVLIVGAGPAGIGLAHQMLNAGHDVAVIDALKIEPSRDDGHPLRNLSSITEDLDNRVADGFGGVAEYGITNRWDKNFLTVLRMLLERRERFALFGGVRFGGAIDTEQAWQLGFDHIALATGAGQPSTLNIPNGLANGVRAANDFLMTLQLGGAARSDSLANLQMQLPAVVIGGGLTAMDAATESLAYYPAQVEKFLQRHETIAASIGDADARSQWPTQDRAIAETFISHAQAIRAERERASRANEQPNLNELLTQWGGVTVLYRKRMIDSPAYRLNPEELACALAEGVQFAEGVSPAAIQIDKDRRANAITVQRAERDESGQWQNLNEETLDAKTILIATGTRPNAIVASEDPEHYRIDGDHFAALTDSGQPTPANVLAENAPVFCRVEKDGRTVSFLGDAHPAFAGNVVKALASAKHATPAINAALENLDGRDPNTSFETLVDELNRRFCTSVVNVTSLANNIVEVVVHAPAAANAYRPGQFFRLQNFERQAARIVSNSLPGASTGLAMEGVALAGSWVDKEAGTIGLIVLDAGASSQLCTDLKPDENVVLMGPNGQALDIGANQTIILIGDGFGNAVLFSIGAELRAAGNRVLYVASYRQASDAFNIEQIHDGADHIIWCCDQSPAIASQRPADVSFVGSIEQALAAHRDGQFSDIPIKLADADRLITIGSESMMARVVRARQHELSDAFKAGLSAEASINSPMQCMMKAVCAQCLQRHVDPATGVSSFVFSCAAQYQPADHVDFVCLSDRLAQNSLAQAQTNGWLTIARSHAA